LGALLGDQPLGDAIPLCFFCNGHLHVGGPPAFPGSSSRGLADCIHPLELAPRAGSRLHRYFPFGSRFPVME
ncbi:MAG: hypothetical protein H6Q41_3711, partial [Deltaproteobacteria bacterium]|nr:hypothetical protein [Deltaproteobacteria bacterium]